MLVAVAVAVACATVLFLTSSDLWFYSDAWPTLTRDITTVNGWTQSHGGHWLMAPIAATKLCLALAGMDFYPWFFLPRLLLYGMLALTWWWAMRRRHVHPAAALAALALLSWMGTTGWMITVVYIGPIVVGLCAVAAAHLLEAATLDRQRQLGLFLLLTVAVSSSADGPGLWAASVVVCALTGLWRSAWLPVGASGAVYTMWYLLVARRSPSGLTPRVPGVGDVLTSPVGTARLIGVGLARTLTIDNRWAWLCFVGLVIVVGALWKTGRLRRFDVLLLLTGVAIAAMGVLVRGAQGLDVAAPNRVYLVAAYLGVGALIPLLSFIAPHRKHRMSALVTIAMLAVAGLNLDLLVDEIDRREAITSTARLRIETAAAQAAAGEPQIPWASVSPQATVKNLRHLLAQGWAPPSHPGVATSVRLDTRLAEVADPPAAAGNGLSLPMGSEKTPNDDGCLDLDGRRVQAFSVNKPSLLILHAEAGDTISIERREAALEPLRWEIELSSGVNALAYAGPAEAEGDTVLTLRGRWPSSDRRTLCGVAMIETP